MGRKAYRPAKPKQFYQAVSQHRNEWLERVRDSIYKLQVQKGENYIRQYRAFEGDWRVITEDKNGQQKRYTITDEGELIEKL